jgi:DNA invertase Pin-like site-specific DNA recombinase
MATVYQMPEATPFMLHIYAAAAQEEARAISARTKAALLAAKSRGVRLGRNGAERLAPANKAAAVERAKNLYPVLADLIAGGASLRQIAAELTKRGIGTPRGGRWHPTTIRRVLTRRA